jgi:hypothetical protein
VGRDRISTLQFQLSWHQHVVDQLTGKDREFARTTLVRIIELLRSPGPTKGLSRQITVDAVYCSTAAAYGVRRGSGVARSYERDGIPRELRRRIQVQAWLDGGAPLADAADRATARQADLGIPKEPELTRAAQRHTGRAGNGRGGRGRGRGQRQQRTPAAARSPAAQPKPTTASRD